MLNNEAKRKFQDLVRKKDTTGLETAWLELLGAEHKPDEPFEVIDLLLKAELRSDAATLLSVLVAHRKEHEDWRGALEALKRLAELNPNERYLRREMVNCYRRLFPDSARLELFLSKSDLSDNRPIDEALRFLDNCLAFDIGNHVYDSELGMGRVTDLDLMLDKLVVDFGKDKPVSFHLAAAFKHLVPGTQEHFLIRKENEPAVLRELASKDPGELLRMLLKGFDRPLKPREIKDYLDGVVDESEWDSFWAKARKLVANDPNVKSLTKPERSLQWTASPAPAAEKQAQRLKPEPAEPEPEPVAEEPVSEPGAEPQPVAQEGEPLPVSEPEPTPKPEPVETKKEQPVPEPARPKTKEEFLDALKLDSAFEHWKPLLVEARRTIEGDWQSLYHDAFLLTEDKRAWTLILKELSSSSRTEFESLVNEVTTYFKKYPAQFVYLQRNAVKYEIKTDLKGLVSRLLDLLDSDRHKPYWSEARNWLALQNDALLRECFQSLKPEEAEQMWTRINRMSFFEDFRKDELRKLVQSEHPTVAAEEPRVDDSIYNTREGIERKEAELRQLMDVEIPKSSEEIGKAREFGDLSENYEYKAAKEKQARLFARVAQLQRDLNLARPIDFNRVDVATVAIGTRVKVEEAPGGEIQEFVILGPWDIDPDKGIISYQAPFAQRLVGKRVGEFVPANPNLPTSKGHKVLEIVRAF